jgi:UDP-N-acetylmuramyl pentapeptide phosphotransferase/UDP-N-acetylglucosamine-1-phosphate transferase
MFYQKLSKNAFGNDYLSGPQKVHTKQTSRLGGIAIFLGLASAIGWKLSSNPDFLIAPLLLLCSLPAFGIGLLEDIRQNIGVIRRMLVIASAAVISCLVLNFSIEKM